MGRKNHKKAMTQNNRSSASSSRRENTDSGMTPAVAKGVKTDIYMNDKNLTSLFPRGMEWVIFCVTLCIRVAYVSNKSNWWILHPDEIFQSLEVAHSEYYGYGFRPYEYMPPLSGDNRTHSIGHLQEQALGMHSLRSFIYPKILVFILTVVRLFGFPGPPFLVWKVFHASITSLLPLTVFKFTKTLYGSRDVAVMAAIFTASSVHLNVLGTHTLANSFISPFLFWSLANLFKLFMPTTCNKDTAYTFERLNEKPTNEQNGCEVSSGQRYTNCSVEKTHTQSGVSFIDKQDTFEPKKQLPCDQSNNNMTYVKSNACEYSKSNGTAFSEPTCSGNYLLPINCNARYCDVDINHNTSSRNQNSTNNIITQKTNQHQEGRISSNTYTEEEYCYTKQNSKMNGKPDKVDIHHLTLDRSHSWENTIVQQRSYKKGATSLPKTEYQAGKVTNQHNTAQTRTSDPRLVERTDVSLFSSFRFKGVLFGFLLGVCVYIRIDIVLFVCLLILPFMLAVYRTSIVNQMEILWCVFGALLGVVVGVCDDFSSYGAFVISSWQWFKFNTIKGYSSRFFGKQEFSFYLWKIVFSNGGMTSLFVCCVCVSLFCAKDIIHRRKSDMTLFNQIISPNIKLGISMSMFFIAHSFNSHKEVRFLHNFIVLLMIFYSNFVVLLYDISKRYINHSKCVISAFIVYLIASQYVCFPSQSNDLISQWSYKGITDSSHVNVCLDFLRQQNDVTGVLVDKPIHMSGAYTILDKNVPLIVFIHNEFREFDLKSRVKLQPSSFLSREKISPNVLTKFSNFISVQNAPYLLKVLIEKTNYNYLVMPVGRAFIDTGYKEVFRSGNTKVMKRLFTKHDELKLKNIASGIPLGRDVNILNYEADRLLIFGQYDKVCDRLEYSLKLKSSNLPAYQMLMDAYNRLGNKSKSNSIYKLCKHYHGYQPCNTPAKRIDINGA